MKPGLVGVVALLMLAACRPEVGFQEEGRPSPGRQLSGSATVFAAASLTESFTELAEMFEADNPSTDIVFNFGASSGLATQIAEQGGADVFASADQANMKKVAGQDLIDGEPRVFARNQLEILVAPGNPKGIDALADLAGPGLKVVLAAPQVPVGKYAREALAKARVTVRPVSEAVDVKGVVGPVTLGEADAGIVYSTDVEAAGSRAAGVGIPEEHNVSAEYPIGLVEGGENPQVARAFIDFVLSEEGRKILTAHGFLSP